MKNLSVYTKSSNDEGREENSSNIIINSCGLFMNFHKDLQVNRPNGRKDYQIIYVYDGKGYFYINDTMHTVEKGNIVLYKPHEPQLYNYLIEDSPKVLWVHFTGHDVDNLLTALGFTDKNIFFVDFNSKYPLLFESIVHELKQKKYSFDILSGAYLIELLSLMSRNCFSSKANIDNLSKEKIYSTIEIIHRDYNKKLSIHNFAAQCNMSTCWFINCFKAITNMTPLEYITKIKIDKSKELLIHSTYNISEISDIVGYDNPLYFSRIFKKTTGISPSHYIKSVNQQN